MAAAYTPHRQRLSTEARRMLPWCVVLVVSAHVLLLAGMAASRPPHAGAPPTGIAERRALTHRATLTMMAPPATSPDVGGAASAPEPAPPASAGLASISRDGGASAVVPAGAPAASAAANEPRVVSGAGAASDARFGPGEYLPRSMLSTPPLAKEAVIVRPPPGSADLGRRVGVLALYIDEAGRVRHVEAEPPLLPPTMEQAAREAFMAASFVPGQVDGHPVRSLVRIEVVFEAAPYVPAITASQTPPAGPQPAP